MEEVIELKQLPLGYVSYSQIRMYKRCPWQYKLRYVDGLKMKPKSNLILGTGVHEGLTEGFKEKKNKGGSDKVIKRLIVDKAVATIEELIRQEQEIEWSEGDNEAVLKDDASKMGAIYYDEIGKKLKVEEISKKFEIEFENVEWKLVGEVDVVSDNLIDWKTGNRKYSDEYIVFDEQLKIYRIVYEKETEIHAIIRYRKKEPEIQIFKQTVSIQEVRDVLKNISQIVKLIKTGVYYKINDYMKCSWCGFREICQNYK